MKKHIKFQMQNAFSSTGFLIILMLMSAFAVVSFIIKCIGTYQADIISVPSAFTQFFLNTYINDEFVGIFEIILPFAAVAAFSDSFLTDLNSDYITASITRGSIKHYYFSKMIAVFTCGALVILLPQLINFLLCLITFPQDSTYIYTWDLWQTHFFDASSFEHFLFAKLYIFSPYLYFLLYILICSVFSGITALIAYQFSFIIQNRIFTLSFMFIIVNLLHRYIDAKGVPYDVNEYIFGNYVGGQTYTYMLLIFAFYAVFAFAPIPLALKKLRNCL